MTEHDPPLNRSKFDVIFRREAKWLYKKKSKQSGEEDILLQNVVKIFQLHDKQVCVCVYAFVEKPATEYVNNLQRPL